MVAINEELHEQAVQVLDDPSRVRSVLSPIRLRLLEELRTPASASSLAERLDTTRQKLGYHLRVLERERLIELAEERQRRAHRVQAATIARRDSSTGRYGRAGRRDVYLHDPGSRASPRHG